MHGISRLRTGLTPRSDLVPRCWLLISDLDLHGVAAEELQSRHCVEVQGDDLAASARWGQCQSLPSIHRNESRWPGMRRELTAPSHWPGMRREPATHGRVYNMQPGTRSLSSAGQPLTELSSLTASSTIRRFGFFFFIFGASPLRVRHHRAA